MKLDKKSAAISTTEDRPTPDRSGTVAKGSRPRSQRNGKNVRNSGSPPVDKKPKRGHRESRKDLKSGLSREPEKIDQKDAKTVTATALRPTEEVTATTARVIVPASTAPKATTPSTTGGADSPDVDSSSQTAPPGKKWSPKSEREAFIYEQKLRTFINDKKGRFLRDENGSLHVIINGARIPLDFEKGNLALAKLMIDACAVTTITQGAQAAIQRLQVIGDEKAGKIHLRRFAAMSSDGERLYVPVDDTRLLRVTAQDVRHVSNGENDDGLWVEHPCSDPFKYGPVPPMESLQHFERLLVDTQACREQALRWLVAMHEGFFPFVRDLCPARLILVKIGPSQSGKTSGSERFTILHGLGSVKGDVSVASLGNMKDPGLLVLDNKEQANLTLALIDYLLFLATGAERGRSTKDGKIRIGNSRPAGVITSIEGVYKKELHRRCLEVSYGVPGEKLRRGPIEREIKQRRHSILSSAIIVLQWFMKIKSEHRPTPNPIPEFEEHFSVLCDLLRAFGEVAGKSTDWSTHIIDEWNRVLSEREIEEEELEHPLSRIFREHDALNDNSDLRSQRIVFRGNQGTIYVTECDPLLTKLQSQTPRLQFIPKSANGLSRRLRSARFRDFTFLDQELAPEVELLRRASRRRPIGFFVPDDDVTINDKTSPKTVIP